VIHCREKGVRMKINQSVDAGPVASALVYDAYPKGGIVKFTMVDGDEVVVRIGKDELNDLSTAIHEWCVGKEGLVDE
jgi:hypothetical protein